MRSRTMWVAIVMALLALTLASPVHAQTFSPADLEGSWELFQFATPTVAVNGSAIRTYRGEISFDATGTVTGLTVVADNIGGTSTLDWNYHELTPSNQGSTTLLDGPAWVNGVITFHGTDGNPGCSEADLVLSDGTVRSQTRGTGNFGFG